MNEIINLGNGQFVKVVMLKGERGSNIATITKTGTSGLVDTYTVTLSDGSTTTFQVTNGRSIVSVAKTGTSGSVDTYTITYNDGTTSTFDVTNSNLADVWDVMNNMGAKNLIPQPYGNVDIGETTIKNGITYTVNADGSITCNGTATADSRFGVIIGTVSTEKIPNGTLVTLSGCPQGGASSTYSLYTQNVNNFDYGNGNTFAWDSSIGGIAILIKNGTTVNNITFKPMLRLASFTSDVFKLYAKTNKELTADVKAINENITELEAKDDELTLYTKAVYITIPSIPAGGQQAVETHISDILPSGAVCYGIVGYEIESTTVDAFRLSIFRSKIHPDNGVPSYGVSIGNMATMSADVTLQVIFLYYIANS